MWEIVAVRKDVMGATHAQMKRADDPKTLKTLAIAALLDPEQFERVGEEA